MSQLNLFMFDKFTPCNSESARVWQINDSDDSFELIPTTAARILTMALTSSLLIPTFSKFANSWLSADNN